MGRLRRHWAYLVSQIGRRMAFEWELGPAGRRSAVDLRATMVGPPVRGIDAFIDRFGSIQGM